MDSEGGEQTDKCPPSDSDPYLLNVLNSMASSRAKEVPDLFQFHSGEVLLWHTHNVTVIGNLFQLEQSTKASSHIEDTDCCFC